MPAVLESEYLQEVLDIANDIWPNLDCVVTTTCGLWDELDVCGHCIMDSKPYTIEIDNDLFIEEKISTLIHELAHAAAGYYAGHGPRWRAKHKELLAAYRNAKKKSK